MLEQYVLEYGGFSLSRGRCHLVVDRESSSALIGDPADNPGTSVTNAVEQVGLDISRSVDIDVTAGRFYQYLAWDPIFRGERVLRVEFRGDAWSMPVWEDADTEEPFLSEALSVVHQIRPYVLSAMAGLRIVNTVVRVRIEAPAGSDIQRRISQVGTIEHISQQRWFYVDVNAESEEAALEFVRDAVGPDISPEAVVITTPNAPLDQPGTLPI